MRNTEKIQKKKLPMLVSVALGYAGVLSASSCRPTDLPQDVLLASTLQSFHQRLKTFLFQHRLTFSS